jgi:predicted lipid-binding transport protein (Tim44 family)
MNNKLEELSKKLDSEIQQKQEAERIDAANKSQAETAGFWGVFPGLLKGAGYGFLIALAFEIFGNKTVGGIIFLLAIVIGGVAGYYDSYDKKRIK